MLFFAVVKPPSEQHKTENCKSVTRPEGMTKHFWKKCAIAGFAGKESEKNCKKSLKQA
ncbi:MAG: hypothetical protein IJN44_11145 [Clostridia bacterium]|nr:hypothetical protein [Clostridia bacterium]